MTYRKKLIEVALPLEAINEASAREKRMGRRPGGETGPQQKQRANYAGGLI